MQYGYLPYIIAAQDFGQFLQERLALIQLGTADENHPALDEFRDGGRGKGRAVSGYEQPGIFKVRSIGVRQAHLYGPAA